MAVIMDSIPTFGMCVFEIDPNSPDEVSIRSRDDPSEAIFIRRFKPYIDEYATVSFPHKHDFYHLSFFLDGAGSYTLDFIKFDLKPGMIFFMVPGQVHSYSVTGEAYWYVVNFSENYFRSFLNDGHYHERFPFFSGNTEDSVITLSSDFQKKVATLFDNMLGESRIKNEMSGDLIKLWMLEALMVIATQFGDKKAKALPQKSSTMISKFRKLVNENFVKLSLPKDYAALLFVTPSYLNQMTHRILGKTAGEVIRDRKLLEAKRMLVNLDLNISQIAYDLNFADASHFSKFFKKYTNRAPEAFRKRHLKI